MVFGLVTAPVDGNRQRSSGSRCCCSSRRGQGRCIGHKCRWKGFFWVSIRLSVQHAVVSVKAYSDVAGSITFTHPRLWNKSWCTDGPYETLWCFARSCCGDVWRLSCRCGRGFVQQQHVLLLRVHKYGVIMRDDSRDNSIISRSVLLDILLYLHVV